MEYFIMIMGINMKDNIKIILGKVKEYIIIIMEINMTANLKKIKKKVK